MKRVSITIAFQDMLSLRYCHHVKTFLMACLLVKLLALSVFGFTERKLYWYLVMQQQVDQFTVQSYFPKLTFMDTLLYSFGFYFIQFSTAVTLPKGRTNQYSHIKFRPKYTKLFNLAPHTVTLCLQSQFFKQHLV